MGNFIHFILSTSIHCAWLLVITAPVTHLKLIENVGIVKFHKPPSPWISENNPTIQTLCSLFKYVQ